MKTTLKHCDGCERERKIWKNHEGNQYCQQCWNRIKPVKSKPTAVKKRLPSISLKRKDENKEYSLQRKLFLEQHPMCQAHVSGICQQYSSQVHHKKGRTGELLLDVRYWLAVCHNCHHEIEMKPLWAKEMGFSLNRI